MHNIDVKIIQKAQSAIQSEIETLSDLVKSIDKNFSKTVSEILNCKGRIVVSGIGKSALIAQKIVATFNSTGTPSIFMHAGDAAHGDMGTVTKDDLVVCLSKSGETAELKLIIPYLKAKGVRIIGMTTNKASFLGIESDIMLYVPCKMEAEPLNLAPTSSTTAMMVIGDALAICLLSERGFTPKDFAFFHPGGSLGKQLFLKVEDLYKRNEMPKVSPHATIREAILEMTSKRLGATAVVDSENNILGIITDGDLRRMLQSEKDVSGLLAKDIMTRTPISVKLGELAYSSFQKMRDKSITQIIVTNESNHYLGMIHLHDLIKEGFV